MAQVSEISGGTFTRSASGEGIADGAERKFRILRATPDEFIDIVTVCGVGVGDFHPRNPGIYCTSFRAEPEGDSRLVVLATFTYSILPAASDSGGGGGGGGGNPPQAQPPDVRPANWSVSTTIQQVAVSHWYDPPLGNQRKPAVNPAGDLYDGLTASQPITVFTVEQFSDLPSEFFPKVGDLNSRAFLIGNFNATRHFLKFTSLRSAPVVETFGGTQYRGFMNTYEFQYNPYSWYLQIPLSGFSVKAVNPVGAGGDVDVYAQPLAHDDTGKIKSPLALPETINAGEKVKGMVRVFAYQNGGASQTPCSMPIPLNEDGTPRRASADPPVIVKSYRVEEETDFYAFGLRFG